MRVVLIGDFHTGSASGLTPFPKSTIQRELLKRYVDTIEYFGTRPDLLICNGDMIDGQQLRGRDLLDDDVLERQMDYSHNLIKMWKPKEVFMVAGTQYHVGGTVIDAESIMASRLREGGIPSEYHRRLQITLRGWFRLDCRHHIGSSTVPHGRFTAQNRARFWDVLKSAHAGRPWPHLQVFSHVHYFTMCRDSYGSVLTLPCWQCLGGNRYGQERCDGHVDLGCVELRVGKTEADGWAYEQRLYQAAVADQSVRR
jgi:hypothetical protein